MPRELNLRGYQSTVMSNDGTQDMFQLLVHRLAGRLNMTRVPVEELRKATLYFIKTDGAGVYNCLFSLMVLRVIHEIDGRPRVAEACFSIPGDGKTGLDRYFAEVGRKIQAYVRAGHNTTNAAENCAALGYEGQIKASIASTVEIPREMESEVLAGVSSVL